MRKFSVMLLLCVFIASFFITACGQTNNNNSGGQENDNLTINKDSLTLYVGLSESLTAEFKNAIDGETVSWTTDDESVVSVSDTGKVTAKKVGKTTVSAYYGNSVASCEVTVESLTITLDKETVDLNFLTTTTVQLTATDDRNINKYDWKSSNNEVAVVDSSGLVTAKNSGTAIITARIGNNSASCTVNVNYPDEYYVLTSGQDAEVYANPGKFYYYGSGLSGYFIDGKATLNVDRTSTQQYYLRYWPEMDKNIGETFNAKCTVTSTKEGYLRLGEGQYKHIVANQAMDIIFANRTVEKDSSLSIALCNSESSTDFAFGTYTLTCTQPEVFDAELSSLEITTMPKTSYVVGETFTTAGMVVKATYNNGVIVDNFTEYDYDKKLPLTLDDNKVVISVGSVSAEIEITVDNKRVTDIVVNTNNVKRTGYYEGDVFDYSGIAVTIKYNDNSSEPTKNYIVRNVTPAVLSDDTVSVSLDVAFAGDSRTVTVYGVNVQPILLTEIQITKQPDKIRYANGEKFSPSGMIVTAYYNNGRTEEVSDYTYSMDALKEGTNKITISYTNDYGNASVDLPIEVYGSDFYVLSSASNAEVYANPGKFYYYGDTGISGYFDGKNAVLEVDITSNKQYFLRFWPQISDKNVGDTFSAECTVTSTKDGYLRIGNGEFVQVIANQPTKVEFKNRTIVEDSSLSIALCNTQSSDDFAIGTYTLTCSPITLIEEIPEEKSISLDQTEIVLTEGESITLTATATGGNPVWSVENDAIAQVSGGVVYAVTAGITTVIAKLDTDESVFASCTVTVNSAKKPYDVFIFMGQSNMAGRGLEGETDGIPVGEGHAFEYRAVTGNDEDGWLYPVKEPFGLNENNAALSDGPGPKTGGMVSAFCESYYTETKVPVIAISASVAGTSITKWVPGQSYFEESKRRLKNAIDYVNSLENVEVRNVNMVWCQGESDSVNFANGKLDYNAELQKIYEGLSDIGNGWGIKNCFIVPPSEYLNGKTNTYYLKMVENQIALCENTEEFVLVSLKFRNVPLVLRDDPHFHQGVYNVCGWEAGKNVASYIKTGKEPECTEFVAGEEITLAEKFGITLKVSTAT